MWKRKESLKNVRVLFRNYWKKALSWRAAVKEICNSEGEVSNPAEELKLQIQSPNKTVQKFNHDLSNPNAVF